MLSKNTYSFKKFDLDNKKNVFIVYGDNVTESSQIIEWLYEFNKDKMRFISVEYNSLSEFIYIFEINNENYYFVAKAYYRNGRLPYDVRHVIMEIDKPDAVIYSTDKQKVLMGFETTSTTLAGNATWQRTGRIINFLEKGIPFGFLAYFSKKDKSDHHVNKKPRKPSALFVLMFCMLSLKYSTPALPGFFEHPDKSQNYDAINPNDDWRQNIFSYLFGIITDNENEIALKKCYENMKKYYFSDNEVKHTYEEFGTNALSYLKNENFEQQIIDDMKNKNNVPFFNKEQLFIEWKPKKFTQKVHELFPNIKFYQLSKNCKAGITFDTKELIDILSKRNKKYVEDYISNNINEPTIIIPIKLTKVQKGILIPTDDPYNGEIPAFANMYLQSFPKANVLLLLCDHTNNNEYDVEKGKTRKIYKSIDKYADIVIDLDLNLFSRFSENSRLESMSKYEDQFTTEDDVTSFFGTILLNENIKPSFLNPPCGSWSDIHLYPTNNYYYYNRNDERGDIAFFNPQENKYYVGESKKDYYTLKQTIDKEYEKTKKLSEIILRELNYRYEAKLFTIFKGSKDEAFKVLEESDFDIVVTVDDTDDVTLEVIERA